MLSHGSVLKSAVLRHVRLGSGWRQLMFVRQETTLTARIEEHGFESTKISDILKGKGKGADGSWLWCTTDDTVYDAVKSVSYIYTIYLFAFYAIIRNSFFVCTDDTAQCRSLGCCQIWGK